MKLYSGRVRLGGEIKNEVNKFDLTASEILILRAIHGASENASDPIVDIVQTGEVKRNDGVERARLAEIYSGFHGEPGSKLVQTVLGVPGVPLPQEYALAEEPVVDAETPDEPVVEEKPIKRTKIAAKAESDAVAAFAE